MFKGDNDPNVLLLEGKKPRSPRNGKNPENGAVGVVWEK